MPKGPRLKDLQALSVHLASCLLNHDTGDVAAWASETGCQSHLDRISAGHHNDRYRPVGGVSRLRNGVVADDDHLWRSIDDLPREIGKALGPPLAGIALDDKVSSLHIAQFFEELTIEMDSCFADESNGTSRTDNRNPVLIVCSWARTVAVVAAISRPIVKSRRLTRSPRRPGQDRGRPLQLRVGPVVALSDNSH